MTVLLTENLPLLSGAPDGIKKLRELILELAVRGKLVPQDPSDEPACELLKSITAEQVRLMVEEGLRTNAQSEVPQKDQYLKISAGWAYSRLGNLARFIDYRGRTPTKTSSGIPLITAKNVRSGFISREPQEFIAKNDYSSWMTRGFPRLGDLLFTTEAPMGNVALVNISEQFALAQRVICFQLHEISIGPFLKLAMMSSTFQRQLLEVATGMTATGVKSSRLKEMPVPLPPLAEQHRIVAKVDELMTLCDRMEAQQADSESAHAQLVQVLLDSLTQASDAIDFATNCQRLAEHFHTLFTTEPSIVALKQTLLHLAVMGKLVPQDPSDEPASELLKHIAEEKARLVYEGKLKKQKPLAKIGEEEKPFALSRGWEWCRINDLVSIKHGYAFSSSYFSESASSLILTTPGNFLETGGFRERGSRTKYYRGPVSQEFILDPGDLIVAMTEQAAGLLGSAAFVPTDGKTYLHNQRLGKLVFNRKLLSPEYVFHYFNGPFLRACIADSSTGMKVKHTSPEKMGCILFPLPPLAEQHRIVAKLDQLMALCDQLKPRLTHARQLNEQLASTLIERALTEDGLQVPIATDRQTARTLLAAEITHQLHSQRTFGQRKLQKVIYLAEHVARLAAIQGDYLRDAAGPHDRQLMNQIEGELQNRKWYERIERETVGYAYHPLCQAGQHQQAYENAWLAAERASIDQVIELMRGWDTDRCEMTVTLYAAWNDFILEGRPVSDDAIVDEVMHSWNDTKLRFGKTEWLSVLAEMKKHKILMPTGFGKRTKGGMLSLPGFE
ncbi:restriction endonuclease [Pseudomonas syringae]|uniref:restriction endonuclease subunit S n=1 Tax=Pseudomonas syringae TaxID=317 RepID=UPI000CDB6786|nr:restriction endonuclease subunit S [Pseudomonas syringae]POP83202.1 restriction endonuclease [Pseudomonas syringae]